MKEHILIDVTITGEVIIEGVGFKGNACDKALKAFEEAAGVVKSKKKKPEYYSTATNQQKVGG